MKTTVRQFAVECQHLGMKTQPTERLNICASYLSGAAYQVALSKRSPECWDDLEGGAASLARSGELLFHLATLPGDQDREVGEALRWLLVEVTAKHCK